MTAPDSSRSGRVPGVGLCWLFLRLARTDPGTALVFSSIFLWVFAFGSSCGWSSPLVCLARCHPPNGESYRSWMSSAMCLEEAELACFRCAALRLPAVVRSNRFRCSPFGGRSPTIRNRATLARHRSPAGTDAVALSRLEFLLWQRAGAIGALA